MHTELRVRTLCELVLNEEFSTAISSDGHEISTNALIGTSANYDGALNGVHACVDKDVTKTIYHLDCLDTAKNGTFSNIWHLHAIASALKRPVTSIYPVKNARIRPLLHRVIPSRIFDHSLYLDGVPLLILWTSTIPLHSTTWSPNHFVPCTDQCHNFCSSIASSHQSPSTNVKLSTTSPKQSHTPIQGTSRHDFQIVCEKLPPLQTSTESTVTSSDSIQVKNQPVSCVIGSLTSVTFSSFAQPRFKDSSHLGTTAPTLSNQNSTHKCQIRFDQ